MVTETKPTGGRITLLHDLNQLLVVEITRILAKGEVTEQLKYAEELVPLINGKTDRVKGNRTTRVPVSWDDLAIVYAGIFRILADKLESPIPNEPE